ncbi:MAG: chlorophyll synthesis pathway protein BchC [Geminicoccaceae bacterium]|nr:chlorophyll synthesis pathway protein BchC [Geminicoccaceae bacterium]
MDTLAVVLEAPERLVLDRVELVPPEAHDVLVAVEWSGISTGTERLLWSGRMPPFPGMGYPLVPGYETVGRVLEAGPAAGRRPGERVFVPGARCFPKLRALFGGAAARLVVPGSRVVPIEDSLDPPENAVLLALAATARHALAGAAPGVLPELIVGHGVLGRLLARLVRIEGGAPVVWERDPRRAREARGYTVLEPEADPRRDYRCIVDVSGDPTILDRLVERLAPGGEIVLAGFYSAPLAFAFAPAFLKEARIRIAAEWRPEDLEAVAALVRTGALALDGLLTHHRPAAAAAEAYREAFGDPACLKMVLDWRGCA